MKAEQIREYLLNLGIGARLGAQERLKVAKDLGTSKYNLIYHLKVLAKNGFYKEVEEPWGKNVIQKVYIRVEKSKKAEEPKGEKPEAQDTSPEYIKLLQQLDVKALTVKEFIELYDELRNILREFDTIAKEMVSKSTKRRNVNERIVKP